MGPMVWGGIRFPPMRGRRVPWPTRSTTALFVRRRRRASTSPPLLPTNACSTSRPSFSHAAIEALDTFAFSPHEGQGLTRPTRHLPKPGPRGPPTRARIARLLFEVRQTGFKAPNSLPVFQLKSMNVTRQGSTRAGAFPPEELPPSKCGIVQ
jgi:hypothetical protein